MDNNKNINTTQNSTTPEHNPFTTESDLEDVNLKLNIEDSNNPFVQKSDQKDSSLDIKKELETVKNQYLRLAADFDNYRKRQDQEKQDLLKYGAANTVKTLLPMLDNLDRAYLSFQNLEDIDKLKESFNFLYRTAQETITKLEISKIKTAGEVFDPNFHEAVMQEETSEYPDNTIMAELQCGYILAEKVLRPAMVKVANNPNGFSVDEEA